MIKKCNRRFIQIIKFQSVTILMQLVELVSYFTEQNERYITKWDFSLASSALQITWEKKLSCRKLLINKYSLFIKSTKQIRGVYNWSAEVFRIKEKQKPCTYQIHCICLLINHFQCQFIVIQMSALNLSSYSCVFWNNLLQFAHVWKCERQMPRVIYLEQHKYRV